LGDAGPADEEQSPVGGSEGVEVAVREAADDMGRTEEW